MSKFFFLCVFLLFSLSQTHDFLTIPSDLETNFAQCFQDIKSLKTELESFLAQGNISMASMVAEYEQKLKPIFSAIGLDCLFGSNESIEALVTGSLRTNWVQCVGDFAGLAPIIAQFVSDIIKKDLNACIQDLTKLLGQVGNIIKDCFASLQ